MKFTGNSGGHYKIADNLITQMSRESGSAVQTRISVEETSGYIEHICDAFQKIEGRSWIWSADTDAALCSGFSLYSSFNDGNGKMSRLLTLLMLYRAGYTMGMNNINIEKLIGTDKRHMYYDFTGKFA